MVPYTVLGVSFLILQKLQVQLLIHSILYLQTDEGVVEAMLICLLICLGVLSALLFRSF